MNNSLNSRGGVRQGMHERNNVDREPQDSSHFDHCVCLMTKERATSSALSQESFSILHSGENLYKNNWKIINNLLLAKREKERESSISLFTLIT